MKGMSVIAIAALLTAVAPAPIAAATPVDAQWTELATFPVGAGSGQLGYIKHVDGGSARGPQALAAATNGDLYILDSVNRRILTIERSGKQRTIEAPSSTYPREILVTQRALYLLDDDNRILKLGLDGTLLDTIALPTGMPTHEVFRLVEAPGGNVKVWAGGYQEFNIDALPSKVDLEAPLLAKRPANNGVLSPDGKRWRGELSGPISGRLVAGDRAIELAAYGSFGAARIIGFNGLGQAYVLLEDVYDGGGGRIGVELSVRRYNGAGLMTGAARLPFERFAIAPRRPAEVAQDGTVYVMVPGDNDVSIYRVMLGHGYRSTISRGLSSATNGAKAGGGMLASPSKWGTSLTRGEVILRADMMTTSGWSWHNTYDRKADGTFRPGNAPKPNQLVGAYDGKYFQGIPYLWGGFDTLWSHSDWGQDLWWDWPQALNRYYPANGPLVGNASGNLVYGSAGVDCAGLVYAALGDTANPKKGTFHLQGEGFAAGPPQAGQPGNYFANNFHTFMYQYRRLDGQGIQTIESTIEGNPQAAKRYMRTYSDAASYVQKSWWAYGPGQGPAQAYTVWNSASSCLFGMNTWYKFTVTGGTNVTLYGMSGGDVDLYVYRQSDYSYVGRSTNGGTSNEYVPINPGSYYAVVHQWSSWTCVSWSMWW